MPLESCNAVNVNQGNDGWHNDGENRFLPGLYFGSFSGIGFFQEVIPAPAKLVAAEESKDEWAKWKDVSGNNKIPKIQKGGSIWKWLEMDDIESKCCGQCQQEHKNTADKASFWSWPASQFTNHGEDIFTYTKYCWECCKDHKKEE